MSVPVLSIQKMSHYFGGLKAVSDFTFDVPEGVIYGLIGPNGSGKTTTFNLVTGIYTPTQGKILFEGKDIVGQKPFRIVHKGIARTFQNLRIFANLTVMDNIRVARHFTTKSGVFASFLRLPSFIKETEQVREECMELIKLMNLEHRAYDVAKNLPYGELRRLEVARALATHPKLILLDEPAAGMNPEESLDLARLIRKIHEDFKLTTLLIERHMDVVMALCERIFVMNFGEKLAEGSADTIQKDPDVLKAYLGEGFKRAVHT